MADVDRGPDDGETFADAHVELEVLEGNFAAGTCVGEPASDAQQDLRRQEIGQIQDFLEDGEAS